MAYQIDRYNNTLLTVVEDGTIDQTTDLKFIGKNYAGYGEIQNENFLFLLENFAGANQPARPLAGQVWFDAANNKLKFYDGDKFRSTGGSETSADEPTGLAVGDFWWDSQAEQLYAFNGDNFTLIGPQDAGEGLTQMQSIEVTDSNGTPRGIIASTINDIVVMTISATEFDLSPSTPIEGFDRIKKGITLKWTKLADAGVTNSDDVADRNYRYWGTASNAERLNGVPASTYVRSDDLNFDSLVEFGDDGISIGESSDLQLKIEDGNVAVIQNVTGQNSTIKVKATDSSGKLQDILTCSTVGLVPFKDLSYNIGTQSLRWKEIYAGQFVGESTKSATLKVGTSYRTASVSASPDTIAARDANGNLAANLFNGTATQARYADLAEKYATDSDYPPGTLVTVGGKFEATCASSSSIVIGAVSTNPAYLMNSESSGQAIALKGRVPIRVIGSVMKGDALYATSNGCASNNRTGGIIGVALETNDITTEKLVECVLMV